MTLNISSSLRQGGQAEGAEEEQEAAHGRAPRRPEEQGPARAAPGAGEDRQNGYVPTSRAGGAVLNMSAYLGHDATDESAGAVVVILRCHGLCRVHVNSGWGLLFQFWMVHSWYSMGIMK